MFSWIMYLFDGFVLVYFMLKLNKQAFVEIEDSILKIVIIKLEVLE